MKINLSFLRNRKIAIPLVTLSLIAIALVIRGVNGTIMPRNSAPLPPTPTPSQQLEMALLSENTPPAVPTTTPSQQSETMYIGSVKLNWAVPGVYSDALSAPTPPEGEELPKLGSIDLGFKANCSSGILSGHVDLHTTQVFPEIQEVPPTNGLAVGPSISGTCNDGSLQIKSDPFEQTIGTEASKQTVKRQFQLIGTLDAASNTYKGEYRETLWGYGPQPITVVGDFELVLVPRTP
jgi:hypothetical protein